MTCRRYLPAAWAREFPDRVGDVSFRLLERAEAALEALPPDQADDILALWYESPAWSGRAELARLEEEVCEAEESTRLSDQRAARQKRAVCDARDNAPDIGAALDGILDQFAALDDPALR